MEFNEKKGVVKLCLKGSMNKLEGYYKESRDFKGLLLIEEVLLNIAEYEAYEYEALTRIYKAGFLRNLGLLHEAFRTLKELEEDHKGLLYNSELKVQGFFFYLKGICLLSQAKESGKNILKFNAIESLNSALKRFIKLGNLNKCKEIYYIEARVCDELDKGKEREEIAGLFIKTVEIMGRLEGMRHMGVDMLKSLKLGEWQMEVQRIVEDNLKIVNVGGV